MAKQPLSDHRLDPLDSFFFVNSYHSIAFLTLDLNRTHRLQQGLQVAELVITQPRLHLDFTDNSLEPLESGLERINKMNTGIRDKLCNNPHPAASTVSTPMLAFPELNTFVRQSH